MAAPLQDVAPRRCPLCQEPLPAARQKRVAGGKAIGAVSAYTYCSRRCTLLAVGLPADFDPAVVGWHGWHTRQPAFPGAALPVSRRPTLRRRGASAALETLVCAQPHPLPQRELTPLVLEAGAFPNRSFQWISRHLGAWLNTLVLQGRLCRSYPPDGPQFCGRPLAYYGPPVCAPNGADGAAEGR